MLPINLVVYHQHQIQLKLIELGNLMQSQQSIKRITMGKHLLELILKEPNHIVYPIVLDLNPKQ